MHYYYAAVVTGRITCLARLSVCLSARLSVWAPKLIAKSFKNQIAVNVP